MHLVEIKMQQIDCCVQIVNDENCNSNNSNDSTISVEDDGDDDDMPDLIPRTGDVVLEENDDIPGLLPAMDKDTIGKDMDSPEVSKGDLFVMEIIADIELEQNNKTSFDFEYLLENVLDNVPSLITATITQNESHLPMFCNLPAVLVDNDDSICYPCAIAEGPEDNPPVLESVGNTSDKQAKIERQHLWKKYGWQWHC